MTNSRSGGSGRVAKRSYLVGLLLTLILAVSVLAANYGSWATGVTAFCSLVAAIGVLLSSPSSREH